MCPYSMMKIVQYATNLHVYNIDTGISLFYVGSDQSRKIIAGMWYVQMSNDRL